jgi:hypothetical protein
VEDIWVEPRYYTPNKYGHIRTSPQTVEVLLNSLNDSKD